jgi:hypothetical protein
MVQLITRHLVNLKSLGLAQDGTPGLVTSKDENLHRHLAA